MTTPSGNPLRVAYLINQYPKVSHSFIRREILALERADVVVSRISVRGWRDAVADPLDEIERGRTRYLLRGGLAPLALAALRLVFGRPRRFGAALRLALSMARRSDRTVFHHLVYLAEACLLVAWLDESPVDHLHAHFGTNPAEVAMLARQLGGPPFSFTVHGPEEFDKPEALGLGEKGRRAGFVVAISSFGRSQLFRWLPQASWDRVEVVHCALDADFHGATSSRVAGDSRRLVCVGRLCEQKGQLLLVQAAARLLAAGVDLELILAGDGEMRPEIEALVERLQLRPHVRITGWIDGAQVRDELLAARALVLPSFAEGLPVVLMEALALRRPVISTFVAGIPELVRPGESGWLVAAGDLNGLVSAMQDCLAAPADVLARMGEAGRARVLQRHDSDREAAKLTALFRRSLGTPAASGQATAPS